MDNLEEGRKLYNVAINLAESERLKDEINQKKNLELAKYFLKKNNKFSAKNCLKKVISIKVPNSIYSEQAQNLINENFR
jgi:hypothetical protein